MTGKPSIRVLNEHTIIVGTLRLQGAFKDIPGVLLARPNAAYPFSTLVTVAAHGERTTQGIAEDIKAVLERNE